jgi:hypothetical protein
MRFVDLRLEGSVLEEEIERLVEDWQKGRDGSDMELHEHIGMKWEEYRLWATTPSVLPFVLATRKRGA